MPLLSRYPIGIGPSTLLFLIASFPQLYTSFAFGGPPLIPRIKRELAACLRRDGFNSVAEAVGADAPA